MLMLFGMAGLMVEAIVLTLTLSGIPMAFVAFGELPALRLSLVLCANKCTQAGIKYLGLDSVGHVPSGFT